MSITFRAISEERPGPKWARAFADYWPAYSRWWAREGLAARPTYTEGRRAIRRHMPEIAGLYDAFAEGRELSTEDLLMAATETVPLYATREDAIKALREWARSRTRFASRHMLSKSSPNLSLKMKRFSASG